MRFYSLIAIILISSVMLFGCSNQTENKETTEKTEAGEEKTEEKAENADALSTENDGIDQKEVDEALEQFPDEIKEKVATSSVPITEILYELGITPVGIPTTPYDLPEEFADIPEIGTSMAPDIEVITSLGADFFIGSESVKESLDEHLKNISLDTAYLGTDNYDDIKKAIKVLGAYFDKEEESKKLLGNILEWENALIEKSNKLEKQKALLIIGMSDSFMVMNNNTYLGSMLERTNMENVAETEFESKETYAAINLENIVQANPDAIFVLAFGDGEKIKDQFMKEVEKKDAWKNLNAYKNDNIQFLDYDVYGVSSIKNMEKALTGLSEYLDAAGTNE